MPALEDAEITRAYAQAAEHLAYAAQRLFEAGCPVEARALAKNAAAAGGKAVPAAQYSRSEEPIAPNY